MDEVRPQGGSGQTAHRRHETKDLRVGPVAGFAAGLVVVGALAALALGWMFGWMGRDAARRDPAASPLAERHAAPPAPRLEVDNRATLDEVRRREELLLNTYGWQERSQKTIRIPIRRAMDLLLERGLPARGVPSEEGN